MNHSVRLLLSAALALAQAGAWAWSNHTLPTYRAFDTMPELAQAAPVLAEPLELFLRAQEKPIADLLASQETWARIHMPH